MKKIMKMMSLVLVLILSIGTLTFAAEGLAGASAASEDTSYTLEEMLAYALQDEKIAQAEYEAIMETFDVDRPFSNIAKAEVIHENAIISLYEAKGLEVPSFDASAYVVIPDTLEETYKVGVQAEIDNIDMYESFLEQDLDDDVAAVFEALKAASENHLAAFQRGVDGTINRGLRMGNNDARGYGNRQGKGFGSGAFKGNGGFQNNTGTCQADCLLNQ